MDSEDDIFIHRAEPSTSPLPSSSSIRPQHLSVLDAPSTRPRHFPDYQQKSYGLGLSPPIRRGSPLNPQKGSQRRSLQGNVSVLDSPPLRHRRIPSPGITDLGSPTLEQEPDNAIFSNEYDLAHEDPRIMLDVQRALKLKARREARLKREQSASPQHAPSSSSVLTDTQKPGSEYSQPLWKARPPTLPSSPSSPTPLMNASTSSDIDFSPATRVPQPPTDPHPVPASLDNGRTLDWTYSLSDDDKLDRRWHLMGKRKDKDKILPLNVLAEQQEHIYQDKLEQIRAHVSSQTMRKAAITREQLGRRYQLFRAPISANRKPFTLLNTARWYNSLNDLVKQSIDNAEPLSWLKHLEKGFQGRERSSWHLSALVMEEYVQSKSSPSAMPTIPENNFPSRESLQAMSPSSDHSTLLLASPEAVSFEPRRDSMESPEDRGGRGSIKSASSLPLSGSISRTPLRSSVSPRQYHQGYTKDDVSSLIESLSDASEHDPIKISAFVQSARKPEHASPQIQVIVSNDSEDKAEQVSAVPIPLKMPTSSKTSNIEPLSLKDQFPRPFPSRGPPKAPLPRRIRISYPSSDAPRRFSEDDEQVIRCEYEARARLLEEANVHNHRVRQTLNRISAAVREYDTIQNAALKTPGIPHICLPKELVEAFSHDPAAVTGSTRKLSGWRAVEDIHRRVIRQREIFQSFLPKRPAEPSDSIHILDKAISKLVETLDILEGHKDEIMSTATNLTEILCCVQNTHREAKVDYNATVSQTSVVYPELSQLVALEESYRDQYQQLWDFGMDALTLLLDTVTPFWRNYGKTIGEDIRDFLIIPLYRNEFTGEPKRYRLTKIPRRPSEHWVGLIVFFFLSIIITFLQVRAAITSSVAYRLQWIPYDGVRWTALPFFWIGIVIQWIAVLFESSVVLMQLGIIAWWAGWLINIFQ